MEDCFSLAALPLRPLLREPLEEAFRREQAALEKRTAQARRLWQAACTARPRIENRSLTDTLAGIGAFWRRYDRRFFAHEVPGDIDYQLCLPAPERLLGADYLISRLSRLLAESRFLSCFDQRAVVRVLEGSCPDYRGLHINLFEPVAVNALGRTLSGGLALDRGTAWYVEAAAALPHNDLEGIFLSRRTGKRRGSLCFRGVYMRKFSSHRSGPDRSCPAVFPARAQAAPGGAGS